MHLFFLPQLTQLVYITDLRLNFQGAILRISSACRWTFPTVSFWGCSVLLGAHFHRMSLVWSWQMEQWYHTETPGLQSAWLNTWTMQVAANGLNFLDTCSLQPNKIWPLARANTSVVLAVISSLKLKSTKLANKKWKLCRYLACWQLFLEQWLKALNSRSDQYKKQRGYCWTWQTFSSDLASIRRKTCLQKQSLNASLIKKKFLLFLINKMPIS